MFKSIEIFALLVFICLLIKIEEVRGVTVYSHLYVAPFDEVDFPEYDFKSPGLAIFSCDKINNASGIFCTLALETNKNVSTKNYIKFCNVSTNLGDKVINHKVQALRDNKAVVFVEHPLSVSVLIVDLPSCNFITSKLYKLHVPNLSVRGWNDTFFDVLYDDEFGKNNRRWTLNDNGTIVAYPQDGAFKLFNKQVYIYSSTRGRLLLGRDNQTDATKLYAIDDHDSVKVVADLVDSDHDVSLFSTSTSYNFISVCYPNVNVTCTCVQYDSNGTFKFELILTPEPYLRTDDFNIEEIQNLADGGMLVFAHVMSCIRNEFDEEDDSNSCKNHLLIKKVGPTGENLGHLKILFPICKRDSLATTLRFFVNDNEEYCLSYMCRYHLNSEIDVDVYCFKDEELKKISRMMS